MLPDFKNFARIQIDTYGEQSCKVDSVVGFTAQWIGERPFALLNKAGLISEVIATDRLRAGKVISIGGLRLRVMEVEVQGFFGHGDYMMVVQADDWLAVFAYEIWRVRELTRLINHRIILTLHVWNLAFCKPEAEPIWNDVFIVRKVKRLIFNLKSKLF